jgi:hypothetical protein
MSTKTAPTHTYKTTRQKKDANKKRNKSFEKLQQNPTHQIKRDGAPELVECTQFLPHKQLMAQRILQHWSLSLSLSLSHTHTHTHTQLARVYTNRVGAMPFCLLQKQTPFLFHLLWISLTSRRINWVPGFFFFLTKENEQNAFFF